MHPRSQEATFYLPAFVLALVFLILFTAGGAFVWIQMRMAPGTLPSLGAEAAVVRPNNMRSITAERSSGVSQPEMGPPWSSLTTPQKLALYPLAERWALISEAQKRRWLTLASNFSNLSEEEQQKFHDRITDWGSLSAQQRNQARLNFAVTNRLALDDKRAQWEAYQALSEKERLALAARAAPKPTGAATALRPVPSRKLAQVPAATEVSPSRPNAPKISTFVMSPSRVVVPVVVPSPATPTTMGVPPSGNAVLPAAGVETTPVGMPSAIPAALPPLGTISNESAAPAAPAPISGDPPVLPPP